MGTKSKSLTSNIIPPGSLNGFWNTEMQIHVKAPLSCSNLLKSWSDSQLLQNQWVYHQPFPLNSAIELAQLRGSLGVATMAKLEFLLSKPKGVLGNILYGKWTLFTSCSLFIAMSNKCLVYLCISHKKGYQSKILACYISFTYNLEMCTIRLCVQLSQLKEEFLQNIKSTTAAFTTTGWKTQASR